MVGRAKDLIIRGGHNVDPAAIEDTLLEHPAVTAAAAVGRPDPHAGEVPVAFVTVAPGSKLAGPELKAWVAEHVPSVPPPQSTSRSSTRSRSPRSASRTSPSFGAGRPSRRPARRLPATRSPIGSAPVCSTSDMVPSGLTRDRRRRGSSFLKIPGVCTGYLRRVMLRHVELALVRPGVGPWTARPVEPVREYQRAPKRSAWQAAAPLPAWSRPASL